MSESDKGLRVLVVEDNHDLAANIQDFLEHHGYAIDVAHNGTAGLESALADQPDVVVLDIMLPGMDGLEVCRLLRQRSPSPVPILMLTAKDTLDDKLAGFDAGADDYLVKPFALKELHARLKAVVRRFLRDRSQILELGALRIDTGKRLVTKSAAPIELNRTGYRILVELMTQAPDVVTRKHLSKLLWGDMRMGSDVLRSHVYALRKAVDVGENGSLIDTVHGVGFRMRELS